MTNDQDGAYANNGGNDLFSYFISTLASLHLKFLNCFGLFLK